LYFLLLAEKFAPGGGVGIQIRLLTDTGDTEGEPLPLLNITKIISQRLGGQKVGSY
jgi:hypothetical protein